MTPITKAQLIAVNTLLSKMGLDHKRRDIIDGFTGGRSTSSRDLTFDEAAEMISHLKSMDPDEHKAGKMRRKIISMAHELHWHRPGSNSVDMRRLDEWCKKFGYGKKPLNSYTPSELPKLVTQFEMGPYAHFYKRR